MFRVTSRLIVSLLCWALLSSARAEELSPEQVRFFEERIRPVLVERCFECHSAGAADLKSGLRLDSPEGIRKGGVSGHPAVVPFQPEASALIKAISYQDSELQMPPAKAGGRLSDVQIADLVEWVKMGAPDLRTNQPVALSANAAKEHWAFQPVRNPTPPTVKNERWTRTPVDQFILAALEKHQIKPSPPADKRTLIRRITIDLTGLPPTAAEVEAFLKDKSADAFGKVVDRLLASPRYGERWGRHWLDVARYADTKGYVYGGREETRFVHSHAYRDWVIRALNEDMPYDRFLRLQLAADQCEDATREDLAAMGFLTVGRRFLGIVHDIIDDRIDVVTRGTLGLTVSCARCHDHKYDPVPTADYYSLYGVFAGSTERMVPLASARTTGRAYLDFEKELGTREENYQAHFAAKRDAMNKQLRAKAGEYLAAALNAQALHTEAFYSFVQPNELNPVIVRQWDVYLRKSETAFHPIWSPWHAFRKLPPAEFSTRAAGLIAEWKKSTNQLNSIVQKGFEENPPKSMAEVATLYGTLFLDIDRDDKKLTKDEEELRAVLHGPESPAAIPSGAIVDVEWFFDEPTRVELGKLAMAIDQWILQSPGAPPYAVILEDRATQKNPHVFRRGNPAQKGEEVPRRFLEILSQGERKPFEQGSGRRELADAITHRDNPLTARVMVNRIWAHHFGAGLVRTTSDFGVRSEAPTHPELLDWLANYFMDSGWSMKKLHRLILLSAVYQQSSNSKRSIEEEQRIAEVDPENKLLSRMHSRRLEFEALRDSVLFASGELDLTMGGKGEELFKAPFSKRRSVYGFIDRQFLPGPYRVFDFANPDMHTPQRSETTVPQQALFFMNGPFVVSQAKALAARVTKGNSSPEARVRELYKLLFLHEPTRRQIELGLRFVRESEADYHPEQKQQLKTSAWNYGYGELDARGGALKNFQPLPHFTGNAWQGGSQWPDARLGWAQLTANGGHAGNDLQHAVVRRWVSPVNGTVKIKSTIKHERTPGHGIRATIWSSRKGQLGNWVLHNQTATADIEAVSVAKGDSIDFVVSINTSLNNNDFTWAPVIEMTGPNAIRDANGYAMTWDAKKDFGGPPGEPETVLSPWESYAQVLMLSNEFLFVD